MNRPKVDKEEARICSSWYQAWLEDMEELKKVHQFAITVPESLLISLDDQFRRSLHIDETQ
jgi:hypothetical protein